MPGSPETSVDAPDRNTQLALDRNVMAAERTLLAWIRTSLAMISFGFTIGKLGMAAESPEGKRLFGGTIDLLGVAYFLVIVGTVGLVLATLQFRAETAGLTTPGVRRRPSVAFVMAVLLSLLGLFVMTDLIEHL